MKVEWDYGALARSYLKRPNYSPTAIDKVVGVALAGKSSAKVCDIGAGTGHLTMLLAERGLIVLALEPNEAMRELGLQATRGLANVRWLDAVAEATGEEGSSFDLVTFGSSFNVTDRSNALRETHRILRKKGWFCCLWNHRDLGDPIQHEIENIISRHVAAYSYGTRREDQAPIITESGLFKEPVYIEEPIIHELRLEDCITAWRSHATLMRQAGEMFHTVIAEIEKYLVSLKMPVLHVPYMTRVWMAQSR